MTTSTQLSCVLALVLAACSTSATLEDGPDAGRVERIDAASFADAAIDPAPDACVPQATQLLVNPAFDDAPAGTGWTQTPIAAQYPLITDADGVPEQTPALKVWLGGIASPYDTAVKDVLTQDVMIPANTTTLVLSGHYDVRTTESGTSQTQGSSTPYDTAKLVVQKTDGTTIATVLSLSNLTAKTTWTAFTHTFTQDLSGQPVRIKLTSANDHAYPTSFYFDSFALLATGGCPQ
jgi:hypothetical protein